MKTMPNGALHTGGYGAVELSKFYPRSMSQSLILSIALQLALIAAFDASREPDRTNVPPEYGTPRPPGDKIPIAFTVNGGLRIGRSTAVGQVRGLKFAIPVPIPFEVPDSPDWSASPPYEGGDSGGVGDASVGGAWSGGGVQPEEEITEPSIFTPHERPPEVVKRVEPKYPVLAVRSGVEGTVTVKVLVSKTGRVRKAIVYASTAEILNDAAVGAALQWVFTPALMNRGSVAVWVFIPFRFRLTTIATADVHR